MTGDRDRTQFFGRITFTAVAVLALGILLGIVLDSPAVLGVLAVIAILIFASNLLLLRDGDW